MIGDAACPHRITGFSGRAVQRRFPSASKLVTNPVANNAKTLRPSLTGVGVV
jgi:hypothetical protein